MKIIRIFASSKAHLYSFVYTSEERDFFKEGVDNELMEFDELKRLFDLWSDALYLYTFFEENKSDLKGINIDTAIRDVKAEADNLKKLLRDCSKSDDNEFERYFRNLNNQQMTIGELEKQKIRGRINRRWLRLYAIRVDVNQYIITGGAIKLTQTMEERAHTAIELNKLHYCKEFLKQHDVLDNDTFCEFLVS